MKIINSYLRNAILFILCLVAIAACNSNSSSNSSPAAVMNSFSIGGSSGTISTANGTITVLVPYGTNITNAIATFSANGSVTVSGVAQTSNQTPNNFTTPLTYIVNSGGNTTSYVVTVTVASSSMAQLSAYSITLGTTTYNGVFSTSSGVNYITVTLPYNTARNALIATYTTAPSGLLVTANTGTGGAAMQQTSGSTANNFGSLTTAIPVTYTVTAADGTAVQYVVQVNYLPNTANTITSYSLVATNGALAGIPIAGVISGNSINIQLPNNAVSSLSSVVTNFSAPGAQSVKVNGTSIISGESLSYTSPFNIVVTSAAGTTQTYAVTATQVSSASAKNLLSFGLSTVAGGPVTSAVITGNIITAVMPYGTSESNLIINYSSVGGYLTYNGTVQNSGTSTNNFNNPVIYSLVDGNGNSESFTVTVTNASLTANAITNFSLNGIPGLIIGNNIIVTVPGNTNESSMVATYTTTGSSVTVGGSTQTSGVSSNNFSSGSVQYVVQSAGGPTQTYYVLVRAASASSNQLTSFSIGGVQGIFTGPTSISVILPFITGTPLTDLQALVATFTTTSESNPAVYIGNTAQISGSTINNFSAPVTYTVYNVNGVTQTYTVTVSEAANNVALIESFVVNGILGTIAGTAPNFTIAVNLPSGAAITSYTPQFITNAESVSIAGALQTSGVNVQASSSVVYTATAANGTTNNYTLTVGNSAALVAAPQLVVPFTTTAGNLFAYVVNFASSAGSIFVCNLTGSGTILSSCVTSGATTLSGPTGIAFYTSSGSSYAYISNISNNSITACAVNATTGLLSSCTTTGSLLSGSGFHDMEVFPSSGLIASLFVVSSSNNSVEICTSAIGTTVSGCSNTVISGLSQPTAAEFNTAGNLFYVTNVGTSTVSVCSTTSSTVSNCLSTGATSIATPFGLGFNSSQTTALVANNATTASVTGCNVNTVTGVFSGCVNSTNSLFSGNQGVIYSPTNPLMSIVTNATSVVACPVYNNGLSLVGCSYTLTASAGAYP